MKRQAEVTGLPQAWQQPSTWLDGYLAVMMHQDSGAAAVVIAA